MRGSGGGPCADRERADRPVGGRAAVDLARVHIDALVRDAAVERADGVERDVAVSAAAFFGTTIEAAVDILAAEKYVLAYSPGGPSRQLPQLLGGWSTHVTSWLDGDFPLLLVRYEDLLDDPVASLRKIVEFLGIPGEHVEAAVTATHFDQLARQEQQQGFRENPHAKDKFFRSGKAGEGKLRLTPEQLVRIETAHGAVMKRLGYL